jgi:hypothetical protein
MNQGTTAPKKTETKEERNKKRKKMIFRGGIGGVVLLIFGGLYMLSFPQQGTMAYGLCKTFLELNVRYPGTLHLSEVEMFTTSARIWYAQVDSFGEYRLEPIQCYFKPDETEQVPFVMEKAYYSTTDLRPVEPKKIAEFNRSLPVLFANPPNLDLPWKLPDSLGDLKFETDKFRKQIFK